jgi:protein-L-isoaspartate(D-aspartate) O-methyltransferase
MTPRDISKLLQHLLPKAGERALAIAAPYAAAVMAEMGLNATAQEGDGRTLAVVGSGLADYGVEAVNGDLAVAAGEGWDLIVSEGAVSDVPESWLEALRPGGRLGVVVRNGPVGKARIYVRLAAGGFSSREVFDATPPVLPGFEKKAAFQF